MRKVVVLSLSLAVLVLTISNHGLRKNINRAITVAEKFEAAANTAMTQAEMSIRNCAAAIDIANTWKSRWEQCASNHAVFTTNTVDLIERSARAIRDARSRPDLHPNNAGVWPVNVESSR